VLQICLFLLVLIVWWVCDFFSIVLCVLLHQVAPPGLGGGPVHLGDDFNCVDHDGVPGVEASRKKRSLKSVRRNLAEEFDAAADEGYGVVTPLAKRVVKGVKRSNKE
jgi:hypothetical protein